MPRFRNIVLTVLGFSLATSATAQTEIEFESSRQLPKWEVGAGFGAISIPYYRGSSESSGLFIPLIVPVYRGANVQVDRRGIRGSLFRSGRWAMDLSADGNIAADSSDVDTRQGMPDLAPSVQIGPSLKYTFWTKPAKKQIIRFSFPLRAVFAIDSGLDSIGYTFSPGVTYASNINPASSEWRWGLYAGFEFGSEKYHDYFYQVADEFERPNRLSYDAHGGYGGIRLATSIRRKSKSGTIAVFARYDRYDEAEFIDSPLVDSKDGLTVGLFVVKSLFESKRTIQVNR